MSSTSRQPSIIAFDADDTLWDHESYFVETRNQIAERLSRYGSAQAVEAALYEVEKKNIPLFGYGVKGFTISVVETAVALSKGTIPAEDIGHLVALGKELMQHPIHLRAHVEATLQTLSQDHPLTLITKGDLFHQEAKIEASGIGHYFSRIEIVAEKNADTYYKLLRREQVRPGNFLMIGNSLRSDILPTIEIGGSGIYIPSGYIWIHDTVPDDAFTDRDYIELTSMETCVAHVKDWIARRN